MKRLFAMLAVCLIPSCLDVADDRADRDERVGHAKNAVMDVDVDDGLACIRNIATGELRVRATAPLPRVHVTVKDGATSLLFVVDAALSDATLEARVPNGSTLNVVEEPGERPTQKRWRIAVPQTRAIDLAIRAPDEAKPGPFRFAVLADVQEAIDGVQKIFGRLNEEPDVRFLVFTGDLTQQGTREQLERFERESHTLRMPLYATVGNHELGTSDLPYHEIFGRGSYHFRFRGVDFTLLDDASATLAPKVYDWLDGWLAAGRSNVHVLAMHIPALDPTGTRNGGFASRGEASKLLAKLGAGRVDLTLYGHVHSYYAFENAGIPAYISGGGGSIPERFDGIGRHFLVVDVDPGANRVTSVGMVRVD